MRHGHREAVPVAAARVPDPGPPPHGPHHRQPVRRHRDPARPAVRDLHPGQRRMQRPQPLLQPMEREHPQDGSTAGPDPVRTERGTASHHQSAVGGEPEVRCERHRVDHRQAAVSEERPRLVTERFRRHRVDFESEHRAHRQPEPGHPGVHRQHGLRRPHRALGEQQLRLLPVPATHFQQRAAAVEPYALRHAGPRQRRRQRGRIEGGRVPVEQARVVRHVDPAPDVGGAEDGHLQVQGAVGGGLPREGREPGAGTGRDDLLPVRAGHAEPVAQVHDPSYRLGTRPVHPAGDGGPVPTHRPVDRRPHPGPQQPGAPPTGPGRGPPRVHHHDVQGGLTFRQVIGRGQSYESRADHRHIGIDPAVDRGKRVRGTGPGRVPGVPAGRARCEQGHRGAPSPAPDSDPNLRSCQSSGRPDATCTAATRPTTALWSP